MPAKRLINSWMFLKTKTILRIVAEEYALSVEMDVIVPNPYILQSSWRMKADGHIVNGDNYRLSHFLFEYWNGWKPKRIRYADADPSNLMLENMVYSR